jgi:hypothetical protein
MGVAGGIQQAPSSSTSRFVYFSHVSLGLLSDSRTQGWGTTKFILREIREQRRGGGIERKLIYVSF